MSRLQKVISIVATAISIFSTTSSGFAQLSLSTLGTPSVVNFDSTVSGVSFGAFAGAGFEPGTATTGRLDSNAWAMTGWSNGNLTFGGTQTTANTDYTRGSSSTSVTTGGVYNFNNTSIGSNSLGFQPGGSDFAPGTVTLRAVNNTGSTISSIDFAYDLYVRNDQSRASTFNPSFSFDNTTYTDLTSLNYTSPEASAVGPMFLVPRSTTITGISIPNGASFYLRWSSADVSGSGNRDEFALDNISLTPVPEPTTVLSLTAIWFYIGRIVRRRNFDSLR